MTLKERRDALAEEKRKRLCGNKIENPLEVCANCVHWIQHYVAADPWRPPGCTPPFIPITHGRCTCGRIKHRKEADTCENFSTLKDLTEEELTEAMNREWQLQ